METEEVPERVVLVGIDRPGNTWEVDETLAELERLAATAGCITVACTSQKLEKPNARTFVGTGKAEEIADLCRSYAADAVIFDDELSPSQQLNIEKIVGKDVKVIDRTALILDIFALHATTKEGCLQVRLAQNEYLLPRLRGMWAHLASNRMGGGVGSRFGEGESQLEVDRRMVRKRITSIRHELQELDRTRDIQRQSRRASGMLRVALAGYTNAGKSSLLNNLTDAQVLSYDKLFATLDSTTRKYTLPEGREITLTDTVGFIQKLPTTLVEAFKSTLDEIREADIILHVIDASSNEYRAQMAAVEDVLEQIGAQKISRIEVFNKCDLLSNVRLAALQTRYSRAIFTSARTGLGVPALVDRLVSVASVTDTVITILVPYSRGDIVAFAHERCFIMREEYTEQGTEMTIRANKTIESKFNLYRVRAE